MAWIKSHSEILTHPKVKKAARTLGISVVTMVGHLHALWWWTLEHAPDGVISVYDPEEVADAVLWEGDVTELFDALINCGARDRPGLLDRNEFGDLVIHDWEEHCGKEYEKRNKEVERLRAYRESRGGSKTTKEPRTCTNDVRTMYETRTNDVRPMYVPCTNNVRSEYVHGEIEIEKEIEIEIKNKNICAYSENQSPSAENSSVGDDGARPRKQKDGKGAEYTAEFEDFWNKYPRKLRKPDALASWNVQVRDKSAIPGIVAASEAYGKAMAYLATPPNMIMHPPTFLNKGRWQEWLPPDGAAYLEARETARRMATGSNGKQQYPRGEPVHGAGESKPKTYEEAKALLEERKRREELLNPRPKTSEEAKALLEQRRNGGNVVSVEFKNIEPEVADNDKLRLCGV